MKYFAYGSNMKRDRLEKRVGSVADYGMAILQDYRIAFNKQSKDGTGKANIVPTERQKVFGVLYELSNDQIKKLDDDEKGYVRVLVVLNWRGEKTEIQTYVALEERINDKLFPSAEYLGFLLDGAKEHDFPNEYQAFLKTFAT